MNTEFENLWLHLRAVLAVTAARVSAGDKGLTHTLACSANPSFPFRAYLAFSKAAAGDQVTIAVEIKNDTDDGGELVLGCAVSRGNAEIVAVGPSAVVRAVEAQLLPDDWFDDWLSDFVGFIAKMEPELVKIAAKPRSTSKASP